MLPQRYGVFQRALGQFAAPDLLSPRLAAEPLSANCHVASGSVTFSRRDVGDYGRTTLLASTPIFSTSASMRSPALRKLPVAAPTPSGVPVAMMSPGRSVMASDSTSMHWSTGKIILLVLLDCRTFPPTRMVMLSACGFGISSAVTSTGPMGQKVSRDLPLNHWVWRFWRSRAVTSLMTV